MRVGWLQYNQSEASESPRWPPIDQVMMCCSATLQCCSGSVYCTMGQSYNSRGALNWEPARKDPYTSGPSLRTLRYFGLPILLDGRRSPAPGHRSRRTQSEHLPLRQGRCERSRTISLIEAVAPGRARPVHAKYCAHRRRLRLQMLSHVCKQLVFVQTLAR